MNPRRRSRLVGAVAASALLALGTVPSGATTSASPTSWVGTWAAGPSATPEQDTARLRDQTVRQVVHVSVGGTALRLRLTNEFGDVPLRLGEVHVAQRAGEQGTDIVPGTDRVVTFSGDRAATIPAGAPMLSDPVTLGVAERSELVVSLYVPGDTVVTTVHGFATQDNVVADGNVTAAGSVEATQTVQQWYFLSGVSVRTRARHGAVVTLGDSITDGVDSTPNANRRWPDLLADRLGDTGVLNAGISGNRLLHDPNPPEGSEAEKYAVLFGQSALGRFDRDVLSQPGARSVVVLLGINDLGHPGSVAPPSETVSADDLIAGYRQLIARAHAAGLRIHGATILPCGGADNFCTGANEAKRQRVNAWIRTSGEYDAVLDFDAATRDPADPQRLRPAYDSGDHLHPNDAGMAAMAAAVPERLFR